MNSKVIRIFAALVILVTMSTVSFAQIRIRFAPGRTSATMTGAIAGGGERKYVAGARNGQTFSGNVSSRNGCVKFTGGSTSSSFTTDTGNNFFSLTNYCNRPTSFVLTVSIY